MKIGTVGIMNNPSSSLNSHSAGWNNIINQQLGSVTLTETDDWSDYDMLVINHGLNFKPGSFNIIGGISFEVHARIDKLMAFNGLIRQVDGFQLKDFIAKRNLPYVFNHIIPPIELPQRDKLIIGDSHAVSCWPGTDYSIKRMDGKTLYGFLKDPVKADFYYFGNIDIRFHLGRQPDAQAATIELANRYVDMLKRYNAKASCLLPVEAETRKLPGTGLYKGKTFFGYRHIRAHLVEIFNYILIENDVAFNVWPKQWYDDIEWYEKNVLEPKQSVHIRPRFYKS